jgi:predicted regulator of Ras-like GTPase activity (Roadblock/LC7/MglB family)
VKLPYGNFIAETKKPIPDVLREYSKNFRGCIHVFRVEDGRVSEGFILIEDGNVLASAYNMLGTITLYQMNALERMLSLKDTRLKVYSYSEKEKSQLLESYPDSIIVGQEKKDEKPEDMASESPEGPVEALDDPAEKQAVPYESMLSTVLLLPGVVAAALVADGFPIFQKGEQQVDFEHIAVATEDIVRSGTRIATELQLGSAEQIILETPEYKVIIAPIDDMFLCVLAKADGNLGLVRLSIKNVQNTVRDMV